MDGQSRPEAIASAAASAATAYGAEVQTVDQSCRGSSFVHGPRFRRLDRRQQYYDGTEHDSKAYDMDGRPLTRDGVVPDSSFMPDVAPWPVPLRSRRPCSPERVAKEVVDGFTNLIFGNDRWPLFTTPGDPRTEAFVKALIRASQLPLLMVQARTIGGSVGTVGLSWRYYNGAPRVLVHNGKHLHPHRWADREKLVPAHVTEAYLFEVEEYDAVGGCYVNRAYWHRRDWTEVADVAFHPIPYEFGKEPDWSGAVDHEHSFFHGDGFCHLVWIRNFPGADPTAIDGEPDYEGVYDRLDTIDLLSSVVSRGGILNLDPTLVLGMDPEVADAVGVRKGSDNVLAVGQGGSAQYLELGGSSLSAGQTLVDRSVARTMKILSYVPQDPDKALSSGASMVTVKALFAPMTAKADVYRQQYGEGLRRLFEQMLTVARRWEDEEVIELDDGGQEVGRFQNEVVLYDVREEQVIGPDGKPTGEVRTVAERCEPGVAVQILYAWPDYFRPSPSDVQVEVTTTTQAALSKVLSLATAVEVVSRQYGVDPRREMARLRAERAEAVASEAGVAPGAGGEVGGPGELPHGAAPRIGRPPRPEDVPEEAPDEPPDGPEPGDEPPWA